MFFFCRQFIQTNCQFLIRNPNFEALGPLVHAGLDFTRLCVMYLFGEMSKMHIAHLYAC